MATATSNSLDHQSAHAKVDRAAERAHEAVNRAAEVAGSGEEKLQNLADELRSQAEQLTVNAKRHSSEATAAVEDYTRAHPFKTLSLAFLIGAVIAFLIRR